MTSREIAVAEGDGIGPEIMQATLDVLSASGISLNFHKVNIGEKVYLKGIKNGISPETWDILRNTQAFLKAPMTTPQGGGFKSINVTIRSALGLYANVRPCNSYAPVVATKHPKMDLVIIRENEEDLYVGMEYQQTPDVVHALKVMTRSGCERIVEYAFQYAIANHRKKVTCFTKDNILKLSDGLFHRVFEEIGAHYPQIEKEHWIVDIGAAKLADTPEVFDVLVMPNLYGDILSDVAAQIAGSVGLAGSANIGVKHAMFEAIHGSAPRRAGQDIANPSGLLLAAVMMLVHLGAAEEAALVHNAWLRTIEEGIHTYDIYREGSSRQKVGTRAFAQAVIERLGQKPQTLKPVVYGKAIPLRPISSAAGRATEPQRVLQGVDVYIYLKGALTELQKQLLPLATGKFKLTMIGNRGAKVWPDTLAETNCCDEWRCRFLSQGDETVNFSEVLALLQAVGDKGLEVTHTENLYRFDETLGY